MPVIHDPANDDPDRQLGRLTALKVIFLKGVPGAVRDQLEIRNFQTIKGFLVLGIERSPGNFFEPGTEGTSQVLLDVVIANRFFENVVFKVVD